MKIVIRIRPNQARSKWTEISSSEPSNQDILPPLALAQGIAASKSRQIPNSIVGIFIEDAQASLLAITFKSSRDGTQEIILKDDGVLDA